MRNERFSRQTPFPPLGLEGQARLERSRVAIVGVGGLGTVIAQALCRTGVGFLRLVDRDYIEESNLPRQILYDEADIAEGLPKALAAARRLKAIDSALVVEPLAMDLDASNVEAVVRDVDVVVDGCDNFRTRLLINEACVKHGIPWVHGGALKDYGATLNILPGQGPCLRCLLPVAPRADEQPTCASSGVLNMATGVIGNLQALEAVKIILKSPALRRGYLTVSLWDSAFRELPLRRDPNCPVCAQGRFELLEAASGEPAQGLAGRDSVQVKPQVGAGVDFAALAARLEARGSVRYNDYLLSFAGAEHDIRLFLDGRAIISKVGDVEAARAIYRDYLGLPG